MTPTMTTTLDHAPTDVGKESPQGICTRLKALCESCQTKSKLYVQALHEIAEHFGSPYAVISVSHAASSLHERVCSESTDAATWETSARAALLESQSDNVLIARLFSVEDTSLHVAVLAVPVCEDGNRPIGAMSVVISCDSRSVAKAHLAEFGALVALVSLSASMIDRMAAAGPSHDGAAGRAMATASDCESLHELAFVVTNGLKSKFGCDQVVLGRVRKRGIRILAISGLDNVYPRSPGANLIRQAMEECLDLGEPICHQLEDGWSEDSVSTSHRLHKRWHDEVGHASVASVPLCVGERCVAVVSMSRGREMPFTREELTSIRELVDPFAPALLMVAKASRSLSAHVIDAVREGTSWLLAPRSWGRKVLAAAILACIAYFCFATIDYDVTVPCRIAPTEIRFFASPFEGTIEASHVEVGDEVVQGQVLYEMDTTDLELERAGLEREIAVLQLKADQALAVEDVKSAALAGAEMGVVQARLATVRHNIAQARVRAPLDGIIVAGEVSKRVGEVVPMGESLVEFVPKGNWSVELLAPEGTVSDLEVGFSGHFVSNARPDESLECKIARIRPAPELWKEKNVFVAEAHVDGNPAWMRAGMEGIARIGAGRRPVWWVALHRVINTFRLTFWF